MTLEEFLDLCELSLVIMVADFYSGRPGPFRQPSEEDMKRKIMRVLSAGPGFINVVLKKA